MSSPAATGPAPAATGPAAATAGHGTASSGRGAATAGHGTAIGRCQGKVEMSYSLQSRNVLFGRGGERVHVILAMPVKRRRAML
ncbi:MAG: hypothetical protein ABSH24_36395, partial [Bryobacteraceae bacterium]